MARGVLPPAAAQETPDAATEVRITARRLADGRVEFGVQQRATSNDAWGQRQLPRARFFPTEATVGRWLNSSPLQVNDSQTGTITAASRRYTAVSAGNVYTCALTTDGTIQCWGDNEHGQTDAPDGTYTAISADFNRTCALTTDGTIECWGHRRASDNAPDGTYTAISIGNNETCALATDGNFECWGPLGLVRPAA
ncbi:MAG: RCC1 domain-containing protein [bacterium]|nr:RCC1 domain-containing protein [bacterium]